MTRKIKWSKEHAKWVDDEPEPDWKVARDTAMDHVEAKAGSEFAGLARDFVIAYLEENGSETAERITLACKAAGITPHDDRAFGPVYMRLMRKGIIEKCGNAQRFRGHGTSGGNFWKLCDVIEEKSVVRPL